MLNPDQRPKITIEDLLRLKRAERPPVEFWSTFERELRQKQLTALLEKRPWWQELRQHVTRRAYLPVGAMAILTFTLVSLKYYSPIQVSQSEGSPIAVSIPTAPQSVGQNTAPVSSPLINRDGQVGAQTDDSTNVAVSDSSVVKEMRIPIPAGPAPALGDSPSARSIAANLEHLEQSEPELINAVLGSRLSPPVRMQAASAPVVELASLSTTGSKRSRLLANYNDRPLNPEPTAPELVRERLSRRLGDADYTDRFSRIGLKGSQVSLKF